MRKKLINSQISNYKTYQMYLRRMLVLAENVFEFLNMPKYIDMSYINKSLLRQGSIAFFYEDVLKEIVALPYTSITTKDIYGRPKKIQVHGANGYTRVLTEDEFVIMYDNNGRYPLFLDITQYAERMANVTRTIDVNINQQQTPRIWKTSADREKTVNDLANEVDGKVEKIVVYEDINVDDTTIVLAPAPYVSDKLSDSKDKIWAEFLCHIGITNLSLTKKERHITEEINAMQGGTVASRFSRFQPRKEAIDKINERWADKLKQKIDVRYYDGEPTTEENNEDGEDYDMGE